MEGRALPPHDYKMQIIIIGKKFFGKILIYSENSKIGRFSDPNSRKKAAKI